MSTPPPPVLANGQPPANARDLLDRLGSLGIESTTVSHPPVFTVEEARAHRDGAPGAYTKNLFLRDKKGVMWLVVAIESQSVDLRALAESLGHKRFSFGSPERLMRYLGVIPGAVTPFAVMNDHEGVVQVALDMALRDHDVWNFHPLDNAMTTTLLAKDMLRFLEAVDHTPRWVAFE